MAVQLSPNLLASQIGQRARMKGFFAAGAESFVKKIDWEKWKLLGLRFVEK